MSDTSPSAGLSLRRLLAPFVRAHRLQFGTLATTSLLGGLAEAGVLVLIARIAFALTEEDSSVSFHVGPVGPFELGVSTLLTIAAVVTLARLALQVATAWQMATLSSEALASSRRDTVRLFLHASWSLQSKERQGHLQELLTSYAERGAATVLSLVTGTVAVFSLVALMVSAFAINIVASFVVAGAAVLLAYVMRPLRKAVRRRSRVTAEADLEFATAVSETTSLAQEIQIFRARDPVERRMQSYVDRHHRAWARTRFISQLVPGLYQGTALLFVVTALAVVYGVGFTRLASLGAVMLIMLRSLSYGQTVQTSYQALNENAPYLEAVREQQRLYEQSTVESGRESVGRVAEIAFDDVWFEYEAGRPVLSGVSFEAKRGEIVGIVGPSGAGKSTLVQLLLRLRQPTAGRILAEGRDVSLLSLDDWFERVTFVPQEPRLFRGTVADNITFFREVDRAEVEQVARLAHIHDEITSWPLGYDTPVGERGTELSVGQRQRLCIARSLIGEPDVIVLDEPTSALDVKSESLVRETLATLAPRVAVFIIAHRLSTLDACHRIIVLQGGRLQGFDEPARLARSSPFYREALRLSALK